MRKALVTGASGQDGFYLMSQLLDDGWDVHGLSRTEIDPSELSGLEAQIHSGDIQDHPLMSNLIQDIKPDAIFNLAGLSSVAQSWEQPVRTAEVNAVAVVNLLDQSLKLQEQLKRPVRFLQASSGEIFGQAIESPQTELTPLAPITPYGAAKAYGHQMVAAYRAKGLLASSAILYNHESPRRPEQFVSRKITVAAAKISQGLQDTLVLGSLEVRRDWGYAPDYTRAMISIAAAEEAEDFIVATGEDHSLKDFVEQAFLAAGISDWQNYIREDSKFARPADPARLVGDPSKVCSKLGWQPSMTFERMVERMVDHDLEQLRGNQADLQKE